jgi:hypothetical protein
LFKVLSIMLVVFLAPSCGFSSDKVSRPSYVIAEGHPRIFLTPARIPAIRTRCSNRENAQSRYYSVLKEFGDSYSPVNRKPSVSDCLSLAFLYAVGEVPGFQYTRRSIKEYGRLGAELLVQLEPPTDLGPFKRYTPNFIACYDWLFHAMTPEQRAVVFGKFSAVADRARSSMKKTMGGSFRETREMYAFYGPAFYGDGRMIFPRDPSAAESADRKARQYCDFFASWWRDRNLKLLEATCAQGGNPAGTMYGESHYPAKLWAFDAWATAGREDIYATTSAIGGFPLFWLYQMLPYTTHVRYDNANGRSGQPGGIVRFGDYRYNGFTPVSGPETFVTTAQAQGVAARSGRLDLAAALNWLAQYQGDFEITPFGGPFPTKKWLAAGPSLVWDIIFRDGTISAAPPSLMGLPLAYHFGAVASGAPLKPDFPDGRPEGSGIVVIRSSWDDPAGTLLWFKASSYPLVHDHRDQGSFQMYKKGWLAIDSGQYEETPHRGNYTSRTIAHNSILVYRPGESLDREKTDPIWKGYANDGGQRWTDPPQEVADLDDGKHFLGGIRTVASVPGMYEYARADITRSYNSTLVTSDGQSPKVSLVTRDLLFFRQDEVIVIFDRVESTQPGYPKRWLLHSVYRPEHEGAERFSGTVPNTAGIPGKPQGVRLRGTLRGGISEVVNPGIMTIRGWNFGPSDGRLLVRTLLPAHPVTRIVGGSDETGTRKTTLALPYTGGNTLSVRDATGFSAGDFLYLGETDKPFSEGMRGHPHWLVDDVYYRGWGKIESVDRTNGTIVLMKYRHGIPKLPEGTVVLRSDHANANSHEFLDAEYNQWQMYGEAVAEAGPYTMQHGNWRIEVEPTEMKKDTVFLHVLVPCDTGTLAESGRLLRDGMKMTENTDSVTLELNGRKRRYSLTFSKNASGAHVTIMEGGKKLVDDDLRGKGARR